VKSWGFGHGMPCWVHGTWGLKKWGCSFSVGLGLGRVRKSRGDLPFLVLTNYWRPGDIFVFCLAELGLNFRACFGNQIQIGSHHFGEMEVMMIGQPMMVLKTNIPHSRNENTKQ
jgi:hypothetical protein